MLQCVVRMSVGLRSDRRRGTIMGPPAAAGEGGQDGATPTGNNRKRAAGQTQAWSAPLAPPASPLPGQQIGHPQEDAEKQSATPCKLRVGIQRMRTAEWTIHGDGRTTKARGCARMGQHGGPPSCGKQTLGGGGYRAYQPQAPPLPPRPRPTHACPPRPGPSDFIGVFECPRPLRLWRHWSDLAAARQC